MSHGCGRWENPAQGQAGGGPTSRRRAPYSVTALCADAGLSEPLTEAAAHVRPENSRRSLMRGIAASVTERDGGRHAEHSARSLRTMTPVSAGPPRPTASYGHLNSSGGSKLGPSPDPGAFRARPAPGTPERAAGVYPHGPVIPCAACCPGRARCRGQVGRSRAQRVKRGAGAIIGGSYDRRKEGNGAVRHMRERAASRTGEEV